VAQVQKADFGCREIRRTSWPHHPAPAGVVGLCRGDDGIADELKMDVVPACGALQLDLFVDEALQATLPDREVLQRRNGLQRVDDLGPIVVPGAV
jgi:hypothetical protein